MKHKQKTILFCVLFLLSLILTIWNNTHNEKAPIIAPEEPKMARTEDFSDKRYIAQLVNEYADYYGVSRKTLHLVVANESMYNYKLKAANDGRTGCHAYGLSQLNTCYMGKGMSMTDMTNPHFALDVMARKIAQGQGRNWTAYRVCIQGEIIIYKGKQIKCDTSKVITV